MNTADFLLENGLDDKPVIINEKHKYTFRDLNIACGRMLVELSSQGVLPEDRVGIVGHDSLSWVAGYLATMKLGAVAVPFAITMTEEDATRLQSFIKCKAVIFERKLMRRFIKAFPEPTKIIFDDVLDQPGRQEWPKYSDEITLDSDAAFMFTSGTTARPRVVKVTHRNIQANTKSIIKYLNLSGCERVMAVLPFYYCFGTSLLHTHLRVGGSLVLTNSFVFPEIVLDSMERNECTGFAGVPSTYQTLLRNSSFPRRGWTHLTKLQQAGGKLQPVLIEELQKAVPEAQVFVMYGQTEATARLAYLPPELLTKKIGSIGKGIPDVTLRVLDESGNPVKPGEVGEIYAQGDNISPGYLNDPEATSEKFINGVLKTGDLATVDEDGYIFVVDRKADFIKSYGFRVSSQQVESVIVEIPEVVAAAVIGEPDLVRGEAIKAFVVLRTGTVISAQDVIKHCAHRLANYMVPKEVIFIRQLPLNANGKVVKNELRNYSIPRTQLEKHL